MSITFTQKRLLIGWRMSDWKCVYYEPIFQTEDSDGTASTMLFKKTTGEHGFREPVDSEVNWIPFYDPATFEARLKVDKKRKQEQFLTDAYKYLVENDAATVKRMESDMHDPDYPRWNAWFIEAKQWKRARLNKRLAAALRRKQATGDISALTAREKRAALENDIDITDDESGDSAYGSDGETISPRRARRQRVDSEMPPPPRTRKRPPPPTGLDGRSSAKRIRPEEPRQRSPQMSGALRRDNGSWSRAGSTRTSTPDDSDDESEFDGRAPGVTSALPPTVDGIPTPQSNRRLPPIYHVDDSEDGSNADEDDISNALGAEAGEGIDDGGVGEGGWIPDAIQHNGGMGEDEALQHAIRESTAQVDDGRNDGMRDAHMQAGQRRGDQLEQDQIDAAIRASMAPDQHAQGAAVDANETTGGGVIGRGNDLGASVVDDDDDEDVAHE